MFVGDELSAWERDTDLVIDPEVAGNCTCLINDCEGMPGDPGPNVTMLEVRLFSTAGALAAHNL